MVETEPYVNQFKGKTTKDVSFQLPDGSVATKTIVVDEEPTEEVKLRASMLDVDVLQETGNTALLKQNMFRAPTDLDRSEYLSDSLMSDFKASESTFVESFKKLNSENN